MQTQIVKDSTSYPSLSRRALAYGIDFLVVGAVADTLLNFLNEAEGETIFGWFSISQTALFALTTYFYSGYFLTHYKQTVGRMARGIEVSDAESGEPLDFIRAGLRDSLGRSVSLSFMGIGYIVAFFRTDRRSLHDLVFKTQVTRKSTPALPEPPRAHEPKTTYDPQLPLDLR